MSRGNTRIAKLLQTERTSRGLSQRELSELSGLTQAQISRIENGEVDMRVSSLIALTTELGLELNFTPLHASHDHPEQVKASGRTRRRSSKSQKVYGGSETLPRPGVFRDIAEELL